MSGYTVLARVVLTPSNRLGCVFDSDDVHILLMKVAAWLRAQRESLPRELLDLKDNFILVEMSPSTIDGTSQSLVVLNTRPSSSWDEMFDIADQALATTASLLQGDSE